MAILLRYRYDIHLLSLPPELMVSMATDRATLLTNLRNKVWGDQTVFRKQDSWADPGTGQTHTVDYLDFGEYLSAVQVVSPTVSDAQFLVREEYRDAVEDFEKNDLYDSGACIMGQPGIGKSCFIAYVVIERLRKKLPVAVQILVESSNECYALFSENGVNLYSGYAQEPLRIYKGIWAFSDSNEGVTIPAFALRKTPGVRVFQTTSPRVERWKEWTKQRGVMRYIMNVWSNEEITALAVLLKLDINRVSVLVSKWGPIPRTLLRNMREEQEALLMPSMRIVASEAIPNCRNILRTIGSLEGVPVDPGPSSIFFIKPRKSQGAISRMTHTIYIPTQTIAEILGEAVCSAAEGHRQDFFTALIAAPSTRGAAGFIFEIWIHSFLVSGNPIECNWHDKPRRSLPSSLRLANQKTVSTRDELRNTTPPFYWRAPPDFPGIDSALFDGKYVYAIQITISSSHADPQPGLDKLRNLLGEDEAKKLHWRLLFIGNKLEQSEIVSRKYFDQQHMENADSKLSMLKRSKSDPIGWCATSPLNAEIAVVKTLTNYDPSGSVVNEE